jgi:release factor glutamine methyltransferase
MAEKLQTISEIRHYIAGILQKLWPSDEADAMATILINEYTDMSGAQQMAFGETIPAADTTEKIMSAAMRASAGEPLQYIFGYTIFCGHRITVIPGVLIPRPETEEMTAMIISENPDFSGTAADLCTGSGCIAIALSMALPNAVVIATENSETALRTAAENIAATGASVKLIKGDILKKEPSELPSCDLIISNPPYVMEKDRNLMHINVLGFEPHEALFVPDEDPLLYYSSIIDVADRILVPGGSVWLEINESQGKETAGLFRSNIYRKVRIIKDIRGKQRFINAVKNG